MRGAAAASGPVGRSSPRRPGVGCGGAGAGARISAITTAHDPVQEQVEQREEAELQDGENRLGHYEASKRITVAPTAISSPSCSTCSRTGTPLTFVPFIEPRSTTRKPSAVGADLGVAPRGAGVGERHGAVGVPAEHGGVLTEADPAAVGQDERAHLAARALGDLGHDVERRPVFSESSDTSVTVTGPEELVALLAGVLPGGLGQLAGERVGERLEALGVVGGEVDADVVGRDERPLTPSVRPLSSTRTRRCPISTGWSPLRKALLKVPSTSRSSLRSNPWSPT